MILQLTKSYNRLARRHMRTLVREICIIVHVGGTRCVTWSIDRIIQIHACITWGVELILDTSNFFHLFLVCLTDITTTIARFFQWLTLSGT